MTNSLQTKSKLTEIEKIVGANIRIARRIRGLTLQELGAIVSVTGQQVQKYEAGLNKIPLEKLITIAKCLKFDMEFFLKKFEI
jgi:transcriptional regulator with XRE-family HTH domain